MTEDPDRAAFEPARLLGALGQAVIATDADGVVRYWNSAAERLYGWSAAEAVGRRLTELTVRDPDRPFAAEMMAVLRSGGTWSGGLDARRKDTSTFPVMVTDAAVYDSQGRIAGLVGVSTELGSAMRPMLARSTDATVVTDVDGVVQDASPAAAALLGCSTAELTGTSLLDLVHVDDHEPVRRALAAAGEGSAVGPEFRIRRRDGAWRWVDLRVTDLRGEASGDGLVLALRDAGERHRTEDRLRELTEQLQAALASRVVIEQAKGALADRQGVDPEQAFEWLRKQARDTRRRLEDVARDIVAGLGSGAAPTPAGPEAGAPGPP